MERKLIIVQPPICFFPLFDACTGRLADDILVHIIYGKEIQSKL